MSEVSDEVKAMATTLWHLKIVEFRLAQPHSEDPKDSRAKADATLSGDLKIAVLRLAQPISEDTGIKLRRTYQCIFLYIYCLPCLQLNTSGTSQFFHSYIF